ncbi:MAG: DUF1214 domain-containing protein [Deltaproteobacteria bacterium]|nr:DUF1214 domain-containing protein [Deltaproteobacteria bacterium]MBW2393505.1 DUF1214 domain-containing protein [Deltaproteobacteria bacterium]
MGDGDAGRSSEAEARVLDGRAWGAFCDGLKRAGEVILREETPATPFDRAEGFRYLTRLLRAGLESQLEYGDPRFPGFYQLSNETIKIGNDNPDAFYQNCTISGRHEYRICGERGSVAYLSLGTKAGGYGSSGSLEPTGQIDGEELEIGPDGRFEIRVSCERKPGNWLPMTPESSMLIVRQTFADRSREDPARLRIECLGDRVKAGLDPSEFEATLERVVAFVEGTANGFANWMQDYARHPNQLPSDDQAKCQQAGGDANIHYLQSCWRLEADEALVIEAKRIPECTGWNFQVSNYWMESLDYRYHRIHLNQHTASYQEDGSVRMVVAHADPGPAWPNWLETAGHRQGGMLFRWVGAEEHPAVDTRVVPFSEL